ncbi:hypothetical protein PANT_8d00079 [Moesziomyces antarcticus T-34]|uniref:Uncharacterized protein n=1 Tax=Pseudozyma antarctica (strain T-34) TaxID=1151754 RepID=M9MC13_PSEA3|nr:hypothetical protein PANT_8d00079 [Moesziomyces antarcticus T-34]
MHDGASGNDKDPEKLSDDDDGNDDGAPDNDDATNDDGASDDDHASYDGVDLSFLFESISSLTFEERFPTRP